jgi:death-on-curing protein
MLKHHALVDGNKRLAWLATATFLELNGVAISDAPNDSVYDLVVTLAAGHYEVDDIGACCGS